MPRIILASASPQRKTILASLGVSFDVVPSSLAESECAEQDPVKRAVLLACMKARDIARMHKDAIVIGCDTLVVGPDGSLLEKPTDEADARCMMAIQSGGRSVVHSGLCVIGTDGRSHEGVSSSAVFFKKLDPKEIDTWIDSRLWQDRSGSFQIEGRGQLLIEKIEGEFYSIVGLPVFLLRELLSKAGYIFE